MTRDPHHRNPPSTHLISYPGIIRYCYNTGDITGTYAGGICGKNTVSAIIFNCYNTGDGTESVNEQGGILGNNGGNGGTVYIYNCWSACNHVDGGIAADANSSGTVIVKNCYYIGGSPNINGSNVDKIALKMMRKFNKNQTYIFNTLQFYRKDRIIYLEKIISDAKRNNFFIGIKLVRGAYHEKEIKRAKKMNYDCPVHQIKNNTDIDYNKALEICIKNIDIISICAGTHNEKSSALLINLLKQNCISNNDKRIYFSQLLGMSDHISYNAAKKGFNVAKYVPYGPVNEMLPYLIRRAEENTSIAGQMGRELSNILSEKKRRSNS